MTGSLSPAHRQADLAIRAQLVRANAALPPDRPPHVTDTAAQLGEQLAESDVAIVDNSAMAFDWLVTGKPLVVTIPSTDANIGVHNSFLDACFRLTAADAGLAAEVVGRALADDALAEQRAFWIQRHFGDVSPGASTHRFLAATQELVAYGAEQVRLTEQRAAELAARHLGPPGTSGRSSRADVAAEDLPGSPR